MGNYHYLIAGLPDLQPDDSKTELTLSEYRTVLQENLSVSDWAIIQVFFQQYDNKNLLLLLENPELETDSMGILQRDELLDIIRLFREVDNPADKNIPAHFRKFIPARLADIPLNPILSWSDQLAGLYFDAATTMKNRFVASWYSFNLNVINIFTAINCKRFGLMVDEYIIGSNDVADALRVSNAKDFGLAAIFPEIEAVMRIADESDLFEREQLIDQLKWNWLDEHGFFHYFDIERLFVYLVRLEMIERWVKLSKENGREVFRRLIGEMQHSFEFPSEFTVRKVK